MTDSVKPRMRGARPTPRAKLAGAMPFRIRGPNPPQFTILPSKLSYWLNDQYGDCVTAEEAFAKACYNPEILIQDSTVRAWASGNGVLDGADLLQVLQMMEHAGFRQDGNFYNDGPAVAVDFTSVSTLQNAISQGPVKIGVAAGQLERVVGGSNGWVGLNFTHDQNEDHSVTLCGYGSLAWLASQLGVTLPSGVDGTQPGYHLFTWDTIGIIDHRSMVAITGEAWLRQPTTVIVGPNPPAPVPAPIPVPVPVPVPMPMTCVCVADTPLAVGMYSLTPMTGPCGPRPGAGFPPIPWMQILAMLIAFLNSLIPQPPKP